MARTPRAVVAATCLALLPAAAGAQGLQRLHVADITMTSDRAAPRVGETFHLTIHARVRERIAALDELVIPYVGTMRLLGDERRVMRGATGTDAYETLTLEASEPGPFTFAGAYFDAIDATTGKPSRFIANPVRVDVAGGGAAQERAPLRIVLAVVLGALVGVMGVLAGSRALRLRAAPRAASPTPAVAVPAPQTTRDVVAVALDAFVADPGTPTLDVLRAALYHAAGVAPGATLRAALASASDDGLREALRTADAATFAGEPARANAAAALGRVVRAWLG